MKRGFLATYFKKVAFKRLSIVETDTTRSNQHEFNGAASLKEMFGQEKQNFRSVFLYLDDEAEYPLKAEGSLTWYDARKANPNRAAEFRCYYSSNPVSERFSPGDLLLLAMTHDNELIIIVAAAASSRESQLLWLFGLSELEESSDFKVSEIYDEDSDALTYVRGNVLELIGIEPLPDTGSSVSEVLERFPDGFPSSAELGQFARSRAGVFSAVEDPDEALLAWMRVEEEMFRVLEKRIIEKQLESGFDGVEPFLKFSLSVQNRRKSRAGSAFENHLEQIFRENRIKFDRGKITENRSKPDFLFPGITVYRNMETPADALTMLGAKTTCKDRWRQILSEAARIPVKHLATLEPGISANQTSEMIANGVVLVTPAILHKSYKLIRPDWILSIREFIRLVQKKQAASGL